MFVIKKISGQCGNRTQISSLQKNPPAFGITPLCWIDKIRTCKPFAYQAIAPPLSYYPICWCDRIWTYFLHIMSVLLYRLSFASKLRSITDSNREHLIDNQRLYHFTNRPIRVLPARFELAWNSTLKVWRLNHVALGSVWLRRFDIFIHINNFKKWFLTPRRTIKTDLCRMWESNSPFQFGRLARYRNAYSALLRGRELNP